MGDFTFHGAMLLARYSFTKYAETRALFFGTVSALSQAIDAKEGSLGACGPGLGIAGAIAREMGLSEKQIEEIELAGMLHDIGKIGVEDQILMKPARWIRMSRSSCVATPSTAHRSSSLRVFAAAGALVLYHHENYDGVVTGGTEGR